MMEVRVLGGGAFYVEEIGEDVPEKVGTATAWSVGVRSAPVMNGDDFRRIVVDRQTLTEIAYACLEALARSTLANEVALPYSRDADGRLQHVYCPVVTPHTHKIDPTTGRAAGARRMEGHEGDVVTPCNVHLPGNVQCPYPALWLISWQVNEPAAYEKNPPVYRTVARSVCSNHLEHALIDDLGRVPSTIASVMVSLA